MCRTLKDGVLTNKNDRGPLQLCHEPFTHCVLPNYIEDEEFLEKLQEELLDLTFAEKNNDLYKFHQSREDLKAVQSPHISALRNLIYVKFKEWLETVTHIPLNDKVDMSCAKYEFTDTLLCHDDELEGRRIAFIYYLVPPSWSEEDGGALDLFTVNENGQPADVVQSIIPVRNNFLFFEVTPVSFHQVAEILSEDKTRLSISGWFHGPSIKRPAPYEEPHPSMVQAIQIEEDVFYDWINPTYMDMLSQADIMERFEEESQIELQNFLQNSKYEQLKDALQKCDSWTPRGPANKRCYSTLDMEDPPEIVKECRRLFQSDAMFLVLSNLTGLKLHELAPESDTDDSDEETTPKGTKGEPCFCNQVRRWKHGSYTLVHDNEIEGDREFALDVLLYIGCEGWEPDQGGITSYIALGADEELLSVSPSENSLALVYRGQDTLHFVKHLNARSRQLPNKQFYDICCTYYE
ncbi:prolyl 3-hydroxylase OGFOD1-like isoform X2 [Mizuhopecten yessoensis]|uniref:prolyl 3-hydroxylase OGFOD1-like isoform X2 n=1 Tax=Mizuhopecten yessoensis TaxID=6573 RepID=UPI000B45B2E9|nr:prolyl 3-hydroxylase OGFOD1-like isoform X2 [Mizuhopecten yessoensis]